MNRSVLIPFVVFLTLFASCSKSSERIQNSKLVKIDFELSHPSDFESVFDSVSWTSLQLPSNTFIGAVDKVIIHKSDIYAFDYVHSQSLYVFDSSGSFKFSINDAGPGPGEYQRPVDFLVTEFGVEILDATDKILKYDQRGIFKEEVRLPFNCDKFVKISNEEYLMYTKQSGNSSFGENVACDLVLYNLTTKENICILERSNVEIPFIQESNNLTNYKSRTWFSKMFSDSIFGITERIISDTLILEFGNRAFPSELLDINKYKIEDIMTVLNTNFDKMYHRPSLFESDKFFITGFNLSGQNYLFYNKINESWQTLAVDNKSNISSEGVPFLFIHYLDHNSITTVVDSNIILDAYQRQKRKTPEIQSNFMNFAKDLDINSAPVLIRYWFK